MRDLANRKLIHRLSALRPTILQIKSDWPAATILVADNANEIVQVQMTIDKNVRLMLLLTHLTPTKFTASPKGAGLKTAILAREMGLIEWTGDVGAWRFRLTHYGVNFRRTHASGSTSLSEDPGGSLQGN